MILRYIARAKTINYLRYVFSVDSAVQTLIQLNAAVKIEGAYFVNRRKTFFDQLFRKIDA